MSRMQEHEANTMRLQIDGLIRDAKQLNELAMALLKLLGSSVVITDAMITEVKKLGGYIRVTRMEFPEAGFLVETSHLQLPRN